jgi:peroxiredoxin (alkyl hydroperoxide reductase subunit C)
MVRLPRALKAAAAAAWLAAAPAGLPAAGEVPAEMIYDPGRLKPIDSRLKVRAGSPAPDFALPSLSGGRIALRDYRGRKNVVVSFVPAAFTPVCSGEWAGYNLARRLFEERDAVLLGVSVDNLPALHAWTRQMGALWFPVLSDFFPHGAAAARFGLLRADGTAERALVFIDKRGIVREVLVSDINRRPGLEAVAAALQKLPLR